MAKVLLSLHIIAVEILLPIIFYQINLRIEATFDVFATFLLFVSC